MRFLNLSCVSLVLLASLLSQLLFAASETFRVNITKEYDAVRVDLATLYLRTYKCVTSVKDLKSGSIDITFQSGDCQAYTTIRNLDSHGESFREILDKWQENYVKEVAHIDLPFSIPQTLDAFAEFFKYKDWDSQVIESRLKDRPRTVYRHRDFEGSIVRVSEINLTREESGCENLCKEVEVAISLGKDYVFFVYNHEGHLTDSAQFPGRKLRAPMSCTGCHYDRVHQRVGRFFK